MTAVRRFRLALAAAVLFALAVAGWQAALHWSARNPVPDATIGLGETAEVDGSTFRLDSIDAVPQLPAMEDDQAPVEAPPGALLVQVVITTEIVGSDVDPASHYCDATAYDEAGRSWRPDSLGYTVAGPAAHSCHGTSEEPIRPGEPLAVGFVFVMPADAVEDLYVDLQLGYEGGMVRLTG
ncbi:hypothetical protein [Pseudactinotalea suaedae]|uniref:hypothetical protein n=1 Tax=Pseudactinotalea suaedae TaxID=1524924 RepID=UPI0012E0E6B8|nr:hypothetical protein [Pseudactinotalea suaedae]